MTLRSVLAVTLMAIVSFNVSAQQFQRPGLGGGGQDGPGGRFPGPGPGPRPFPDDNFNRPVVDMEGAYPIGSVDIGMGVAFGVLSPNVDAREIRLCVNRDDLALQNLSVLLSNGQLIQLAGQDYVRRGTCLAWMQLTPAPHVLQVLVAGNQLPGPRRAQVTIFGRIERPRPMMWNVSSGGQNACGDSAGPFIKDQNNNQILVMACPDQKPNGGPIGQPCQARGQLCYGWRENTQPGFYCAAPNGKTPPMPAYIYSMYECR